MSREIKFRAWDMVTVKMVVWEDLLNKHDLNEIFKYGYDLELMQYTGLKDKNGKEIYEGDIVKWWGYEVQFGRQLRPERIIYINDYIKDTYKILCITEDTGQTVEVIGNIFEDGDLIANR